MCYCLPALQLGKPRLMDETSNGGCLWTRELGELGWEVSLVPFCNLWNFFFFFFFTMSTNYLNKNDDNLG